MSFQVNLGKILFGLVRFGGRHVVAAAHGLSTGPRGLLTTIWRFWEKDGKKPSMYVQLASAFWLPPNGSDTGGGVFNLFVKPEPSLNIRDTTREKRRDWRN